MALVKKYWWVITIVIIILYLVLTSNPSSTTTTNTSTNEGGTTPDGGTRIDGQPGGCTPITIDSWREKKTWWWQRNGQNWELAHQAMLDEGFCEWLK